MSGEPSTGPASQAAIPQEVAGRVTLDVRLAPERTAADLEELRRGLLERPRRLPSKYFYDERGSELFERITELPEYYLTRTERRLLERLAGDIVETTGAEELVELGSGAATKTRILLDAMEAAGRLRCYVAFDVSESEVRRVAVELAREYPRLEVHGMVADFTHHLGAIPEGGRRLVILLGSTIGNYRPAAAVAFLRRIANEMSPGDDFLLGADLIKDPARLDAAYNDSAGVTAEFNRNLLRVVNGVADGDFDPAAFRHRAFWDPENCWIEMRLVSERRQRVRLAALDLEIELGEGEELLTEISAKYDRRRVASMLDGAGFDLTDWHTDPEGLFALALARRRAED